MPVPDEAGVGSSAVGGLAVLSRIVRGDKTRRAVATAALGMMLWDAVRSTYRAVRKRAAFTVALPSTDDVYDDVHSWLLAQLHPRRRRSLVARSGRQRNVQPALVEEAGASRREGVLLLRYEGTRVHTVNVAGHRVRVEIERQEMGRIVVSGDNGNDYVDSFGAPKERIVFTASSADGRDAVTAFLADLAREKYAEPRNRFYIATRWGDWQRLSDLPRRSLGSIVLRERQAEELVADLEHFLDDEDAYGRVGLPWHRGYVFEGPPGTGKTSMAKALAEHFEMDVHYIPLSDVNADTNLLRMFASVEARSMLVLEDVDVVHATSSRDDAETANAISLSGLLNALDGLVTPHGLVTVMTTNQVSGLDAALLRPGRADRVERFDVLDDSQLARLLAVVTGDAAGKAQLPHLNGRGLSHAEVVEVCKPYLTDPPRAVGAVRRLIEAT